MSLEIQDTSLDGFDATVAILRCDATNKKIAEIIVRDSDADDAPISKVIALSPFEDGADSGEHELTGLLSIGVADIKREPLELVDIRYEMIDNIPKQTIVVKTKDV